MPLHYRQYEDVLPQPPPSVPNQAVPLWESISPPNPTDVPTTASTSLQSAPFCMAKNVFGLLRQFFSSSPPSHDLEEVATLQDISSIPTVAPADLDSLAEPHDPFYPYPNQLSFELGHWYWNSSMQKSHQSFKELLDIVGRPDFNPSNVQCTHWDKINSQLGANIDDEGGNEWEDEDAGWHKTPVTIEVPFSQTTAQPNAQPYIAADLYHWSLVSVIQEKLANGEMYTSPAFMDAHRELQVSPGEAGCDLPRVVASLMFWSDATQLMTFDNSKYHHCRLSCRLGNHVAYFQKLPDSFKDFVGTFTEGKGIGCECTMHCHRQLFQAQWRVLLDHEFLEGYKHGIVILCCDGIACRFYLQVFTYSADYPKK
ncbi:hypothetical protein BDR05DRAFT_975801 [Suillus weaverae]|nr:hypothetical protein BDR05DRAFT_975801 [Suillus weaverae]